MFDVDADYDDFTPSSSSNLPSIFNATAFSDDSVKLSYKAPKQPKGVGRAGKATSDQNPKSKVVTESKSSVLLAKVITLWKLENGQNKLLGKHMVALIGNTGQQLYELIVYQEKRNIIIRKLLNETLTLYKYPKNFIGFYDDQQQFWNLSFDTFDNQESFLNEFSIHKCQVIEQKTSSSTDDQVDLVDHRIGNLNVSKTNSEPAVLQDLVPLVNDQGHSNENSSKDQILSRITKMGRQILPRADMHMERKTSTDLSDSEMESSYSKPKPTTAPRKLRRNPNQEKALAAPVTTERNILNSSYNPNSNQRFLNNNQMALNPHGVVYSQPYTDYGVNNFIISQNAELKANLAEINLKLNTVLNSNNGHVDKNGNSEECDKFKSRIKCLKLKIENLTTDLERSQQLLEDLKKKYDSKCSEIIEEKGRHEKFKDFVEEAERLKEEEMHSMKALQMENEHLKTILNEKNKLLGSQQLSVNNSEAYLVENQRLKDVFEQEISELHLQINELSLKATEYCEENKSSKIQRDRLDKDKLNEKVKETMNEAFTSIMEQFEENEQYDFKDIQKVVLQNLKKTTYKLINSIE